MSLLRRFLAAALALAAFAGCTTQLASTRLGPPGAQPVKGVVYYLQKTVFDADVTIELRDCRVVQVGKDDFQLVLDVARSTAVTTRTVADMRHTYLMDYEELRKATKTTAITWEHYRGGALKSINADIKDKSAEVLAGVVSTTVKLASIASHLPVPNAVDAAKSIDDQEKRFCARYLTHKQIRALGNAPDDRKAQAAAEIARLRKADLTRTLFVQIDPDYTGNMLAGLTASASLTPMQVEDWVRKAGMDQLRSRDPLAFVGGDFSLFRAEVALAAPVHSSPGAPSATATGVYYRMPYEGEVAVCAVRCTDRNGALAVPRSQRDYSGSHAFAQLGQLAVLPLSNGTFQDSVLKAEFAEAGGLTKVEFTSSSQAEKAATAASATVGSIGDYISARDKAKEGAMTKSREDEIKKLEHEIALLKKRVELDEARKAYDKAIGTSSP